MTDRMAPADPSQPVMPSSNERWRDLAVPFHLRFIQYVLCFAAGGIVGALLCALLRVRSDFAPFVGIILAFVALGIAGRFRSRRTHRVLRAYPGAACDLDLPAAVQYVITALGKYSGLTSTMSRIMSRRKDEVLCTAAELLARHGGLGNAFRLAGTPAALKPIDEPPTMPFEPTALKQSNRGLQELRKRGKPTWRDNLEHASHMFGRTRWFRVLMIVGLVLTPIGLVVIAVQLVQDALRGRVPAFLVYVGFLMLVGLGQFIRYLYAPEEWFVVPGAVVVRRSNWRSGSWDVTVMPRDDTTLIYWFELHSIAIADRSGRSFSRRVTPAEAEVAVWAWSSPLPPPGAERLSDLR